MEILPTKKAGKKSKKHKDDAPITTIKNGEIVMAEHANSN
jgi:hypothetical protein